MSVLKIDLIDLSPELLNKVIETSEKAAEKKFQSMLDDYKKKNEIPDLMNYSQAAKYMNTSYNTLKYVFVEKLGLPIIMIEGYERISKSDADEFLDKNKKIF